MNAEIATTTAGQLITYFHSFEDWRDCFLRAVEDQEGLCWRIGDYLVYAEEQEEWKDKCAFVIQNCKLSTQTLYKRKWVSKVFDVSRRREELTWSHHAEIATFGALLNREEQDFWLNKAVEEGIASKDLRALIRGTISEVEACVEKPSFSPPAMVGEFMRWTKTLPDELPDAQRVALKEQLKPIVEYYERL